MESLQSRNLKSETMTAKNPPGKSDMSFSCCFGEGHIKKTHHKPNQLVSRSHEKVEEEWIRNLTKFLQLMKISSVEISEKSLSNVTYKPSLNRDVLLSFQPRCSKLECLDDITLKSTSKNNNTWRFNRKVMRNTILFPADVTLIDLIEFTGKSAQTVNWANVFTEKTNGDDDRHLAAQPNSKMPLGSDSIKDSSGKAQTDAKSGSNRSKNLPSFGSKAQTRLNSHIRKGDGEDVVDCFTYYANTILPQRHGSPEESELSNGIIKEINKLYWKYKNFNVLEDRLSLEEVRNDIIRNLSKRKLHQMMQKCKFTCLEDCILLVSFEKQNLKDFTSADCNLISNSMPWRSVKVIKRRLEILLRPSNFQFTIAEDRLLLKAVEILGPNWIEISRLMRREKSRRACRSRYNLLVRILRTQSLEEWYQKCQKKKSLPVMLTGQILKIFCAISHVISHWELVEPQRLSHLTVDSPPHNNDLECYLRSFDFSVVRQTRESFRDRMRTYFESMTCKSKNYAYEKMKFERKIPQSWAAALYTRGIELKPIWDIEAPSRFELAIYYYYHQNYYSKETMKKETRSLMPSQHDLIVYPEVSNIINKKAFHKKLAGCKTEMNPDTDFNAGPNPMSKPAIIQRTLLANDIKSDEEDTDTDSASDWETLSDEESSSEDESVSDTATVSDWDTFSDTESCSDSDEEIIEFGESDSDDTCQADIGGPPVSPGEMENNSGEPKSDTSSQIICFQDVQLAGETKAGEQRVLQKKRNPQWMKVSRKNDNHEPKEELTTSDSPSDLSALELVLLDHSYCQTYTYSFKKLKAPNPDIEGSGGFRKVPHKCFQNVKQQVCQHNASLQTTEGKRYRKRVHRGSQTTLDKNNL